MIVLYSSLPMKPIFYRTVETDVVSCVAEMTISPVSFVLSLTGHIGPKTEHSNVQTVCMSGEQIEYVAVRVSGCAY